MLELRSISKRFPGVQALQDVSLQFSPGEIHAVVGENGAGKSTAMKIITGILRPDAGQIVLDGTPLEFRSYRDSLRAGIDIVSQELQVLPRASVAENIMLDKMITRGRSGIIDWGRVNRVAQTYMDMVGLRLPASRPVHRLSAAQKQLAQIAKALAARARVLLLDEPTSSLTEFEARNLFAILRELRAQGVTILFVSHKFEEVFGLCDRVSVLRDGRVAGGVAIGDITPPALIAMMIGREYLEERLGAPSVAPAREVLRAEHLARRGKARDVSFSLAEGEILGFYGLVGAGRTEVARILIGEEKLDRGRILVGGRPARIRRVADSLYRYRLGYVTENRKEEGLFLDSSVKTNIAITAWPRLVAKMTRHIRGAEERAVAARMAHATDLRCTGLRQKARTLSGGNQQKLSIAKWLAADCDILIIDEPSVGVDVGAKAQIHRLIWDLARHDRKSIILISSDMPEIIRLSDRILVFRAGRIAGEVRGAAERPYGEVSAEIGSFLGQTAAADEPNP